MCYVCACAKEKSFQDYLDYGRVPCNCAKDHGGDCVNVVGTDNTKQMSVSRVLDSNFVFFKK